MEPRKPAQIAATLLRAERDRGVVESMHRDDNPVYTVALPQQVSAVVGEWSECMDEFVDPKRGGARFKLGTQAKKTPLSSQSHMLESVR